MADTIFGNGNDQWVCPNDRQLALRAKYVSVKISFYSILTIGLQVSRECNFLNGIKASLAL